MQRNKNSYQVSKSLIISLSPSSIIYSLERQRKLEELRAQALATQKLREQKEEGERVR